MSHEVTDAQKIADAVASSVDAKRIIHRLALDRLGHDDYRLADADAEIQRLIELQLGVRPSQDRAQAYQVIMRLYRPWLRATGRASGSELLQETFGVDAVSLLSVPQLRALIQIIRIEMERAQTAAPVPEGSSKVLPQPTAEAASVAR